MLRAFADGKFPSTKMCPHKKLRSTGENSINRILLVPAKNSNAVLGSIIIQLLLPYFWDENTMACAGAMPF